MIILEGPDGAGKSLLAGRLAHDLKLPIAEKVVGSDTQPLVDLKRWTEQNIDAGFQPLIFDRHRLISEPIYGPATRSNQDPNFSDLGWMIDMTWRLYQARPLIVYCLPHLDVVRGNVMRADTNNTAVSGRIGAIYAGYVARASLDMSRGVGKIYNYRTTRYEDVLLWLKLGLENHNEGFITGDNHQFSHRSGRSSHHRG